jgi:lipopolysaccharide/colanic/teichoic acid biosynthesis glycosyltransferase
LVIATAIAIDSRGPVLFRQVRAGRNGKTFKVSKFRTMHRDAEERKKQYEDANEADDGVMFKIKDDPRITRVGGFLRRTSLDELPQLINVLAGQMSLVGPRPLILEEAEEAAQSWHVRRLDLRPGITGLWQISGRSDLPFEEMVRFDYEYVSGWSLARDVEILLATIPAVLSGRGAY